MGSAQYGTGFSDWVQKQRAFAASFAGIDPNKLDSWQTGFGRTSEYDTSVSGSATATQGASSGGTMALATGITASSRALVTNNVFMAANAKTSKWFIASRTQITSATDAQAKITPVAMYQSATELVYMHVTNGQLIMTALSSGSSTDVTTSWTVDTTAPHDFAMGFDKSTLTALVDGVPVGSTTVMSNMTPNPAQPLAMVENGTTTTTRTETLQAIFCGLEMP